MERPKDDFYFCNGCHVKFGIAYLPAICPLCGKVSTTKYSSLSIPMRDFSKEWRPSHSSKKLCKPYKSII